MSRATPTDKREFYLSAFKRFEDGLNGETGSPLHEIRRRAIDCFAACGFPSSRDEDWRHTSVTALTRAEYAPATDPGTDMAVDTAPFSFPGFDGVQLVFVNGRYCGHLSTVRELADGVRATSLASALIEEPELVNEHLGHHAPFDGPGFAALNTAFVSDGAFVHIPKGVRLQTPIHLLYLSTAKTKPTVSFPRALIVVEDGAAGFVAETFAGLQQRGAYLTAAVTEIVAGDGCELHHCKIQRESDGAFHTGALHVTEGRDCNFTSHNAIVGGQLVRNDTTTLLAGEGIESTLNGVFLGSDDSRIDNHTTIEHAQPNCNSHELYKGILGDHSQGVFRGKIHVHQVAQKTNAYQSNQNLLLSDDADITSKPQLEIYADDVKCSHGSTTGQLDAEAIFYLRSRGIGERQAVSILTRAFADEIVDRIPNEAARLKVGELVASKLSSLLRQRGA